MFSVLVDMVQKAVCLARLTFGMIIIFGKAFRLQLRGEIGTRELRTGQIVFSSPWMLNTPTSLDASLYITGEEP